MGSNPERKSTHRDLYITCPLVIFMKDQPIWTYPALAMEKSSEMSMSKFIRTYWKLKKQAKASRI